LEIISRNTISTPVLSPRALADTYYRTLEPWKIHITGHILLHQNHIKHLETWPKYMDLYEPTP